MTPDHYDGTVRRGSQQGGSESGAWQGKCFGEDGQILNRIALSDEMGMSEPTRMFPGRAVSTVRV
jgi:hypothetical protein